jgi:hypothetical protein
LQTWFACDWMCWTSKSPDQPLNDVFAVYTCKN